MTTVPATADTPYARQAITIANMVSAVCGGLSLVLAVTAPLAMRMTTWTSSSEVMVAACVRGGLPFLCVVSIVLSRWFWHRELRRTAVLIAVVPFFVMVALLTLGIAAVDRSGVGSLFPRGEPAVLEHLP